VYGLLEDTLSSMHSPGGSGVYFVSPMP
jgi:hypothetical protein